MSSSHDRVIKCYPSTKYSKLLKAYAALNEMSNSESTCLIIKKFFDSMPESERQRLLKIHADNLL